MRSFARHLVVPLLCRPVYWAQSMHIDAGTAKPTMSSAHVHQVAGGSPEGSDQSSLSSSDEDPCNEHPEGALPTLPPLRWRRDALQPPELQRGCLDRNTSVHIPKALFDVSPGIREGLSDPRFLHKLPGKRNIITSVDLPEATTSSAFKKFMARTSFFTPFRYEPRACSSSIRLYKTMRTQVYQPHAFIKETQRTCSHLSHTVSQDDQV